MNCMLFGDQAAVAAQAGPPALQMIARVRNLTQCRPFPNHHTWWALDRPFRRSLAAAVSAELFDAHQPRQAPVLPALNHLASLVLPDDYAAYLGGSILESGWRPLIGKVKLNCSTRLKFQGVALTTFSLSANETLIIYGFGCKMSIFSPLHHNSAASPNHLQRACRIQIGLPDQSGQVVDCLRSATCIRAPRFPIVDRKHPCEGPH